MKHKIENLRYFAPDNLCYCRGILNVDIDGKHYTFEKPFWESGGRIWFDNEYIEHIEKGDWWLNQNYIPKEITKEIAEEIIEAMNQDNMIARGCCGGCS